MEDSMTNYQAMQLEIFQHMDETSRYHWPLLEEIGLRPSQLDARMLGIGGSDANVIFGGDEARLTQLWREKRGEVPSADLSHILPVMMGQWTEAFNRQWYQQQTGYAVDDVGLVAIKAASGRPSTSARSRKPKRC
jgi:predicted phage-related endonuclease